MKKNDGNRMRVGGQRGGGEITMKRVGDWAFIVAHYPVATALWATVIRIGGLWHWPHHEARQ